MGSGQWLWLSWQSGHVRYQRSALRIQTTANFYITFIYCIALKRQKKRKKVAGNGLIFLKRPERGLLKLAKANT